ITVDENEINRKREILQETLDSFRIKALTGNATAGPRVTLFEIIPEKGVKVEKIANLNNNIAMELQAEKVRILAPIPGRRSVGIEVPNDESSPVCYRTLLESKEFKNSKATLPIILGKDISGKPIIMDLAKAPHLLIAGATGAGKSVFMNTLILSLLFKFEPDELQMIMVDPKFVELTGYNTIPHLICPVITDPQRVPSALRWAVFEMDCRYQILATVGVKNLEAFNNRTKKPDEPGFDENGNKIPDKLPTTIIIIDELADLMMMAKKDVETSIARIAQKARAVGIHLVIATQRPSVDVVTGIIKANFPTRIAFKVSSNVDSKTILDRKGAEELLGMGDMLFMPPGSSNIIRIQGAWVKDEDIEHVVNHCAKQQDQNFIDIFKNDEEDSDQPAQGELFNSDEYSSGDEDLIEKAIEVIRRDRRASTSHIQRRLRIGYNRAATIMEALEERCIVGPQVGSAKREIYLDRIDGDE
ncbi:MAG: DNA translocase FtsK, partial [Lentisphaeraceae bacterium]|nr:DNA translocase FtsK [Lentisphaeraceae bacterium]